MAASSRRGNGAPAEDRRLSVAEARFYAAVYGSARRGCLSELRRKGCGEDEAEEIFTAALERVMGSVDPVAREFSEAQMVTYIKRACWSRFVDARRRRGGRAEIELGAIRSLGDSNAPDPEEVAEEREAVAIGREALQMLSERDRLIFCQRHQMDLSPEEIVRRTPGLSPRTYRKVIQRANARVLEAFERIRDGGRCEEMQGDLLHRYVVGQSPIAERHLVKAHLAHCRRCRQAQARMRGYLVDVAGGALVVSSSAQTDPHPATRHTITHLLERGWDAVQALGEASRSARERVREALMRIAGGLPGSPGDVTAGQALSASTLKVASACAGVAAGACISLGVVPDINGVDLPGDQGRANAPPTRVSRTASKRHRPPMLIDPLPRAPAVPVRHEGSSERGRRGGRKAPEPSTSEAQPTAPASSSPADARLSGRQTGTEVGAESGGEPLPSSPLPRTSGSSDGRNSARSIGGASPGGGSEFGM
jgi:RNA polymerase sigma factor (sigma-70 family)